MVFGSLRGMKTPGESEVLPGLNTLDLEQESPMEFCHAVWEGLGVSEGPGTLSN